MEKKASERALELFHEHYNCAQAVYAGSVKGNGMSEQQRIAVAAAFGGGMARRGEVCGALTGALMALGERQGANECDPTAFRATLYKESEELMDRFRAFGGAIHCRALTQCRLNTAEGQKQFKENNIHATVCDKLVAFAAEEVEKLREKMR